MEVEEEVKRIIDEVKELHDSAASFISSSSQQELSLRQKASSVDSSIRRLHSTLISNKILDPKLVEKLEEDLHRARCMLVDGDTSSFLPSKPQGGRQAEARARKRLEQSMFQECNSYERHVQMVNCVVEAEDPSFIDVLWKSTIEYLIKKDGHTRGWTLVKELHKIKPQWRHVPFVVAMIHKMVPNGIGDAMVILKDPTGTVEASIHRSVISDNNYGPHIKEGSVLLLKEVVVVKFQRATTYLNICLQNITNVISKENMATSFIQASTSRGVSRHPSNWLSDEGSTTDDGEEVDDE